VIRAPQEVQFVAAPDGSSDGNDASGSLPMHLWQRHRMLLQGETAAAFGAAGAPIEQGALPLC
jgi:hypothetical protein